MAMIGHKTPAMLSYYTSPFETAQAQAASRIDDLLRGLRDGTQTVTLAEAG
jgi:hypothetical protein